MPSFVLLDQNTTFILLDFHIHDSQGSDCSEHNPGIMHIGGQLVGVLSLII